MKTTYEYSKELIQKVVPSMSFGGGSLAQWQVAAKSKLSQLLGMDKFEKVDLDVNIEYQNKIDGATEVRFTYQSEAGYRVPCHLWLPDGVERPPVMICLQGHSTGMHISLGRVKYEGDEDTIKNGDRDFCVRAVQEGFAAIALEQRNFGECKDVNASGCMGSSMASILMGRTTIGQRVWDISRLIDVIENVFADKVDANKICCMGNSGGGTATAYAAALEDRIVLAMPSCAMCTYKDSIGASAHCSCNFVPHIAEYFDMNDLMAMACPKFFVQVSGAEDSQFPLFGAESVFEKGKQAYQAYGDADRCSLVVGKGGHRFYADDAWPIVHKYLGECL